MHKGICIGGPMAGVSVSTRSDIGFVAVDAAGFGAWLYYIRVEDGAYVLDTRPDPSSLDVEDGTRAFDPERGLYASDKGLDLIAIPGDPADDPGETPEIPPLQGADGEGED